MSPNRHYPRAAGDPAVIRAVAVMLAEHWDPQGEFADIDGTRDPVVHARTVLGMLGTGPDTANVSGYLRRAEEAALGEPRSTGRERQGIAEEAWRMIVADAIARRAAEPGTA